MSTSILKCHGWAYHENCNENWVPKISQRKKSTQFFPPYFLLSWLRITSNALFKSSVVMFEVALLDTYENKSPGAIPTKDGRAYHNNCIKEWVPKIFPKNPMLFSLILLISWLHIGTNALSKLSGVISGGYLYKGVTEKHPLIVAQTRIQPQLPSNRAGHIIIVASKTSAKNISRK